MSTNGHALQIGWATKSITPDLPVQLHGQHHERISSSVHDEIAATAFVVSCDAMQAIFLSCDVVAVPRDLVEMIRESLKTRIPDIDATKLIVAATHTHTAPTLSDNLYPDPPAGVMSPARYREFLVPKLVDIIESAWESRVPSPVAWELGYAPVGFNRRTSYLDGHTQMYGATNAKDFAGMEGGCDHGVELMYSFDDSGALLGIVVNLSCPSQIVESNYYISGDFWSTVRRRVRERFGEEVHVLPLCGAAGDQSPRDLVRGNHDGIDFRNESGMEEMGRRILLSIEDRYKHAIESKRPPIQLAHEVTSFELDARKITEAEADSIRRDNHEYEAEHPTPQSSNGGRLRKGRRALERYESQGDRPKFPVELHAVRIDDRVFATNPFELFLDYGLRIKARSRAEQTFVAQLVGDRALYLPTKRAVASGHYGTIPTESFVGPAGGDILVEKTLALIESTYDDTAR